MGPSAARRISNACNSPAALTLRSLTANERLRDREHRLAY
jgi:hypothetical protein